MLSKFEINKIDVKLFDLFIFLTNYKNNHLIRTIANAVTRNH